MRTRSASVHARMEHVWASFKEALRAHGMFYFRRARVVAWETSLSAGIEPGDGVDVREASREDLELLATAQNRDPSDWAARIARGCVCLVAWSDSARMGSLWITRSAERMSEVDHVLDVTRDPAGAYLFDGFVLPEHRRKGVLRSLLAAAQGWAVHQGVARLYAAFARENHVSGHALQRAGFVTLVGDVGILRTVGLERKWVHLPRGRSRTEVLSAPGTPPSLPRPT